MILREGEFTLYWWVGGRFRKQARPEAVPFTKDPIEYCRRRHDTFQRANGSSTYLIVQGETAQVYETRPINKVETNVKEFD